MCAGRLADMRDGSPDVVEDGRQREVFLTTFALTMPTKVEPQRRHPRFRQAVGHPREEAALVASDPATVDEDDSADDLLIGKHERAAKVQAVEGADGGAGAAGRHVRLLMVGCRP